MSEIIIKAIPGTRYRPEFVQKCQGVYMAEGGTAAVAMHLGVHESRVYNALAQGDGSYFPTGAITAPEIAAECARAFGLESNDLKSPTRARNAVNGRFMAMHMIRQRRQWSYPQIGRLFRRDHTSIMNGIRKMSEMLKEDSERGDDMRAKYAEIEARFKAVTQ